MTPLQPNRTGRPLFGHRWFLLCAFSLLTTVFAAQPSKQPFDIPADTAESSLKRLSEQSGVEILFPTDAVAGVFTNSIRGEMTARQALEAMLAGTPLVAVEGKHSRSLTVRRLEAPPAAGSPKSTADATTSGAGPAQVGESAAGNRGTIEGRVLNGATGNYIENARVRINGTSLETFTNSAGEYRFTQLPPGEIVVTATSHEFNPETKQVQIAAGQRQQLDYSLRRAAGERDGVVSLDSFTVNERILSAQSAAITEQRVAKNIKNVVSFDEFGDITGDGNPGEFLKYVPGMSISFGPATAQWASVRGMPFNNTLVTVDGSPVGSSSGDRQFELTGGATGNIDRIEVTKSPTPDMPANAVGGGINIVGKSGFSRSKPLLTYSVYSNFNSMNGRPESKPSFDEIPGSHPGRTDGRPIQPGFDISYILPVNKSLAFTFSGGASNRYNFYDQITTVWDIMRLVNQTYSKTHTTILSNRTLLGGTIDWKVNPQNSVRATLQHSKEDFRVSQLILGLNYGANATGDATFTQSRPGVASATHSSTEDDVYRDTRHFTLKYKFETQNWTVEADGVHTEAIREINDVRVGTFSTFAAAYTLLTLRGEGLDGVYGGLMPRVTATNNAGAAVDVFNGGALPVTAGTAGVERLGIDTIVGGRLSVQRSLQGRWPMKVKTGLSHYRETLDQRHLPRTWNFTPPGGATSTNARQLGLINDKFSSNVDWYNSANQRVPIQFISAARLFELFQNNPSWFALNEVAAHSGLVNGSKLIVETISAAYVMADAKFFENRMRLTTGVRFEHTLDEGAGPLNDIGATYVRDAAGNIVRNAAGAPVRITTNALEIARLQYKERGSINERTYGGYYPSLNGSYDVTDRLVARVAYARTIGRPSMAEITPGVVFSDPTSQNQTITVNNTGLTPWTSDSYDISIEAYDLHGAVASVGVFRKDIDDFFMSSSVVATPGILADYGLDDDYVGYELRTKENGGSARVTGLEWSYRQDLGRFLPAWGAGLSLFVNGTHLRVGGENADDFAAFNPRKINWGVGYVRPKYLVKLNVSRADRVRNARVAPSATIPVDTFGFVGAQTLVDISAEYKIARWIGLYGTIRNALQSDKYTGAAAADTPDYASRRVTSRFGGMYTVGLKGQF